ncbi:MAG: hypothetical protein SV375_17755 [Thermodesulfobacteriota bacterium]|nr:hypothetical protein [Thermodesulfobacteriota bacterium]
MGNTSKYHGGAHGSRPDKRWGVHEIPELRKELGLDRTGLADHVVGMIGWIQSNKRWDILLSMWEEIHKEVKHQSGQDWDLLAAGTMRNPAHREDYEEWKHDALHHHRTSGGADRPDPGERGRPVIYQ